MVKTYRSIIIVLISAALIISAVPAARAQEEVPYGGWLDSILATEIEDPAEAITRLRDGEIDVFAQSLTRADLKERVQEAEELDYLENYGSSEELTLNPAGTPEEPYFEATGELNPFARPRFREALNWLVDREYIVDEIYGGLAESKYTMLGTAFMDYSRHISTQREIEVEYSHDPEKASERIEEEMLAMGAEKVEGDWYYQGEPVTLTGLIRTEDARHEIGDYAANLLEDEGFEVERRYVTADEASPIWMTGNPHAGEWSFYTGAWISTVVSRDEGADFDFFFTNRGLGTPLYQEYDPPEELDETYLRLSQRDFSSLEEREKLFEKALWGSMSNAKRIWLTDSISFSPLREDIQLVHDYAGGLSGAWLWAHTLKSEESPGGTVEVSQPSILTQPWNPTDGSNWIFDMMLIRATSEGGYTVDPYTGLHYPKHFDEAEVYVQKDLPVEKTHDWVDLERVEPEDNRVPEDAWYKWDAEEERFITAGEKFEELPRAKRRVRTRYPDDKDIYWHDGSEFTAADVVWNFIELPDRASEESDIYDESKVSDYQSFMDTFLGFKIVEEDPLIVDYYSDVYYLDAELYIPSGFPLWNQGSGAWHNMNAAFKAEAEELAAHTSAKADALEIEHVNYVGGPSLEYIKEQLEWMKDDNYIPYENTLGEFIDEDEAERRYENLYNWYEDKGHFWIGTGPYYLEAAHPVEGMVELERFEDYPYRADRWEFFEEPMVPRIEISAPDMVDIGEAAEFELELTHEDSPYPAEEIREITYLLFDEKDNLVAEGDNFREIEPGRWELEVPAEKTEELITGSSRLEVIVSTHQIASPIISSLEFVSVE